MGKFDEIIQGLKDKIFGTKSQQADSVKSLPVPVPPTESIPEDRAIVSNHAPLSPKAAQPIKSSANVSTLSTRLTKPRTDPHFVQIGFDFGTAYSKCICRDVMIDKAWVHIPTKIADQELPFLIPSTLLIENDQFTHLAQIGSHYPPNGLNHLKLALEKVALKQWSDPALDSYRRVSGYTDSSQIAFLVEASVIYFLAGVLGEVRRNVQQRLSGFGEHPDDYIAVNLAVPVADAECPPVNDLYHRVLCHAWILADQLSGHPPIRFDEFNSLLISTRKNISEKVRDACFIYPEVSANVQGFVRSRASSEGLYLFSDTGAGTVDQSVFIFTRNSAGNEHLAYMHGSVHPLGSSCIEHYAAHVPGKELDWTHLERLRKEKEAGGKSRAMEEARKRLVNELERGTTKTLALSRKKLFRREQINDTRVIFGGGGHCENPYKTGALLPFSGNLFAQTIRPDIVGLPTPVDLELNGTAIRWLPRLSVAYGLSFEKSELARFTYPSKMHTPSPEELWRPKSRHIEAASKDCC